MATTSWVQSDVTAIEQAIKSGVMTVKYRDREVTYRSLQDMLDIRAVIQNALGANTSIVRQVRMTTDNGFSGGSPFDVDPSGY